MVAEVSTSMIALWLGHEQERTTHIHLHADLEPKQRTLDRLTPPEGHPALPSTRHSGLLPRGPIGRRATTPRPDGQRLIGIWRHARASSQASAWRLAASAI